jgi:hypothetical protein
VSRNPTFTQAEVRRAVRAAESAGLRVRRVTIGRDGTIVVDGGDAPSVPVDNQPKALAASWDDV